MNKTVSSLLAGVQNILFPSLCVSCDAFVAEQQPLCRNCRATLKPAGYLRVTTKKVSSAAPALKKRSKVILSAFSGFLYTSAIRELLHHYKYTSHYSYLASYIAELLSEQVIRQNVPLRGYHYMTCVPMHPAKLREREFNHAALLGKHIGQAFNIPFEPSLLSVKRNYPLQSHLSEKDRRKNPLNRFTLKDKDIAAYHSKAAIIIDDVFTTGTTLFSCVNELLPLFPPKLLLLTLARA